MVNILKEVLHVIDFPQSDEPLPAHKSIIYYIHIILYICGVAFAAIWYGHRNKKYYNLIL